VPPRLCELAGLTLCHLELTESRDGPEVARCAKDSSIPHSASRAAPGIDKEFSAWAQPSPSWRRSRHSSLLTGSEFSREVKKALSAADWHK
jgi:hypothetical protein